MEKTINQDEVNALLAAEIRKVGLNDAIKLDKVKEKVMQKIKEMNQSMNEMENPAVAQGPSTFPNPEEDEERFKVAPDINQPNIEAPKIGMEAGTQPLGVPSEPKIAIIPEVPDFLKDVEPGKIFVYDFNELSVGGENLSNKPFKTMENPDVCKSMQQMWSENGVTKVEVYQTKFEKIGDIIFDYKSGQSQFIQRGAEPDFDVQQQYKQNPYAADPTKEIESYLKNTVDVDQKVNDVITNIVKNYFLTNSERAVNDNQTIGIDVNDLKNTNPVPPQQMGINRAIQEEKVTMKDLIEAFQKIDTPAELLETIEGKKNSAKLVYEDREIKKWILNDKEYYFPSDPMSTRKCYVK